MPRNVNGTYTLPLPPVVANTTIEAAWANTTDDDIAQALTDSLDRYGRGGMAGPFRLVDGTVGAPGLAFTAETGTGLYRPSAGVMGVAVQGAAIGSWSTAGLTPGADATLSLGSAGLRWGTIYAARLTDGVNADGSLIQSAGTQVLFASGNQWQTVNFWTDGANRMSINSQGYVGVGTDNATQLFQVGKFDKVGTMYQRISGQVIDLYLGQTTSDLFGLNHLSCAYIFQDAANNTALAIGTLGPNSLNFGTNNIARLTIAPDGVTTYAPQGAAANEIGFRDLPLWGTGGGGTAVQPAMRGSLMKAGGNVDVRSDVGMKRGDIVTVLNTFGSAVGITQIAGMTMYWVGGGLATGSRALAVGGMATIWFDASNVCYISGTGLS